MTVPENFNLETDWMGVDFDGTLHIRDKSQPMTVLGEPIPEMVERVKQWLALGMKVKILTARVSHTQRINDEKLEFIRQQRLLINEWCYKHIGEILPIVCEKDCYMYQLWDDRAVTVERNTGKILGQNKVW